MKARGCIFLILLSFLCLAASPFADGATTQGGSITIANLTAANSTSTWYGVCGSASGSPSSPLTLTAVPGTVQCFTVSTGSSGCAGGNSTAELLFSNSSVNASSLSPGNLTTLDNFISRGVQNGTGTFTLASTFSTAGYGSIAGVPTAYTNPSAAHDFPLGYLQDQSGNLVFITPVTSGKAGFNGSAMDFQAMLPTQNGTNTTYTLFVDLMCNSSSPPPPPPPPNPGGGGIYIYRPANVTIPYYSQVPPVQIAPVPPNLSQLQILRFTPYREASPGDQVVVDPLIYNPSGSFVTVGVGLSGAAGALSTPAQDVLLAPYSKQTVPFSVMLPSDMPGGYYAFSVQLSLKNASVSYPSIVRVVPVYRIGEPVVHREFLLDYQNNETTVVLTVTNTGNGTLPHLQVFESLPPSLARFASQITFTAQAASGLAGDVSGTMSGPNIRWDLQDIQAGESRSIFYSVPLLVTDTSDFSTWNLAQIVAINPAGTTDVLVSGLQTPTLLPGGKGQMTMTLFNAGVLDRDVEIDAVPPAGWSVTPLTLTLSLPSRQSQDLNFLVQSPSSADAGTYGFTINVKYADVFYGKSAYFYVNKPTVEIFAPPLTDQLTAFLGANVLPIVFVAVAGGLMLAGLYFAFRFINSPRFDEGRLEDMQNMERMFDQKLGKRRGM